MEITQEYLDRMIERELRVLAMAKRIDSANPDGAMHIVIADGNLDGDDIYWCLHENHIKTITPEEIELCNDLLAMTLSERHMAYEIINGRQD